MNKFQFRSISDVTGYLDAMPRFQTSGLAAARFGLDSIRDFCSKAGNPHDAFRSIHIAGTNGKGTTAHMLHSVYMAAGFSTGLFTSPHLLQFNERFRINGAIMPDEDLLSFFEDHEELINRQPLTYFELSAAIAFWYFNLRRVDIAIIETGLGGRLDATNIITPECSVITSIGLDHTDILGGSLESIAREKCGIIKQGVPVVAGRLPQQAMTVVRETAERLQSPLMLAEEMMPDWTDGTIQLSHPEFGNIKFRSDLVGPIQSQNAAVASAAALLLNGQFPVSESALIRGLSTVKSSTGLAGRYEKLLPGSNWYFDGGHNIEALKYLGGMIKELGGPDKATAVIALNNDKATNDVLDFYKAFKSVYFYRMDGGRSAEFEHIAGRIPDAVLINSLNEETFGPLLRLNREELVIFSGSFYFYPVVKRWVASLESS